MSASGSQHSIAMESTATYGDPPTTPTWDPILHNGGTSGGLEKDNFKDETITTDRTNGTLRHGARKSGLSIPFTLRYDAVNQQILEAILCGTWTGSPEAVTVGSTRRAFCVEELLADFDAGANKYQRHLGSDWNTYGLNVTTGGNVTGTCSFVAQDKTFATTAIADSTYPAAATTGAMSSFVGSIDVGGVSSDITELSFNLDNKMEGTAVLFSTLRNRPPIGKLSITGNVTAEYNNDTLEALFDAETSISITLTLEDEAGNELEFAFTGVKFTGAAPSKPNDLGMTIALPWEASSVTVTRTPAA